MSYGGSVIDSGGFGCIFKPALKCNPAYSIIGSKTNDENGISKLLYYKHGNEEYNFIKNIIPYLSQIPNHEHYFFTKNISLCQPSTINETDLKDFHTNGCDYVLNKKNIKRSKINQNLDKLLILNMPYGGKSLQDFIGEYIFDIEKMIHINDKMVELLVNGILPMNRLGIYHSDIKASNILVNIEDKHLRARLIDWGLSYKYTTDQDMINIIGRPLQFNLPFSCILLNDAFMKYYADKIKENPNLNKTQLYSILRKYIYSYSKNQKHLNHIHSVFHKMYGSPDFIKTLKTKNKSIQSKLQIKKKAIHSEYIIKYLYEILIHFTRNGEFEIKRYLEEIYLHNLDIWSFILSYLSFTEELTVDMLYLNTKNIKPYVELILDTYSKLTRLLLAHSYTRILVHDVTDILQLFTSKMQQLKLKQKIYYNLSKSAQQHKSIKKLKKHNYTMKMLPKEKKHISNIHIL